MLRSGADSEKIVLKPLSPQEVCEDQIKMREKKKSETLEKEKRGKKKSETLERENTKRGVNLVIRVRLEIFFIKSLGGKHLPFFL